MERDENNIADLLNQRRDKLAAEMREAEMREKMNAAERNASTAYRAGLSQGVAGLAYENEPMRPGLRERVNSSFYRAERESRNVSRLKELADLLDTNPALARILELIEQTGV
jgi:hypothetical protein